jgi:hypothetical protein
MNDTLDGFVGEVFCMNALRLLHALPTASIDALLSDPMYMVATKKSKSCVYDWGPEPGRGTADEFWAYHHRIYAECRRVLKPGGALPSGSVRTGYGDSVGSFIAASTPSATFGWFKPRSKPPSPSPTTMAC